MAHTARGTTIGELGEAGLLSGILSRLREGEPSGRSVLVGPGDDTAYLGPGSGVLATTDTMVRGRDWLDAWSSAGDVGAKVVVQNLADIAAMGGIGTALLVTLVAPGSMPSAWVLDLVDGVAEAAEAAGVAVVGGDLSSSDSEVVVSVTALGMLPSGRSRAVLRSEARAGHVLAVSGDLGRSAAGLELLRRGDAGWFPPRAFAAVSADWVGYHCRPAPDLGQGPIAAAAGASAMIDVSDGLIRDAGRMAMASGVRLDLDDAAIRRAAAPIAAVLGDQVGRECVAAGGEEHVLLATFDPGDVPPGWDLLGRVTSPSREDPGVWCAGQRTVGGGWDHFGG